MPMSDMTLLAGVLVAWMLRYLRANGDLGFQHYRLPPHRTATYQPILIFQLFLSFLTKFIAKSIETENLENFLGTVI